MAHIHVQIINSPVAQLILGSFENKLCLLDYYAREKRDAIDKRLQKALGTSYIEKSSAVIQSCKQQLDEYFAGQRRQFELEILPVGTDFQKQIWQALQSIEYGQSASYLQLAQLIGKPKAVRAVANATGANALSIIIPCHRIIGSNGHLVGYAGGLQAKQALLEIESSFS